MNNSSKFRISSLLNQWMLEAQIKNYRELSTIAKVSELQFYRLENGLLDSMSWGTLKKIADALNIPLTTFISSLSDTPITEENNQKDQYQQEAISILESLILQLPTFIYAVEKNPLFPADKLLPLLKPLEELLEAWNIIPIGAVGEIVSFNPQEHEVIDGEIVEANMSVKIRYVGYRQGDNLLYRAKVSS